MFIANLFVLLTMFTSVAEGSAIRSGCARSLIARWEVSASAALVDFAKSLKVDFETEYGPRNFLNHLSSLLELSDVSERFRTAHWNVADGLLMQESAWARRRVLLRFAEVFHAVNLRRDSTAALPADLKSMRDWAAEVGLLERWERIPIPAGKPFVWRNAPDPQPRLRSKRERPRPVASSRNRDAIRIDRELQLLNRRNAKPEDALIEIVRQLDRQPEMYLADWQIVEFERHWRRTRDEDLRGMMVTIVLNGARKDSQSAARFFREVLRRRDPSGLEILADGRFGLLPIEVGLSQSEIDEMWGANGSGAEEILSPIPES